MRYNGLHALRKICDTAQKMKFPQESKDLVTFTEDILNGKFQFLCSASSQPKAINQVRGFLLFRSNKNQKTQKSKRTFFFHQIRKNYSGGNILTTINNR